MNSIKNLEKKLQLLEEQIEKRNIRLFKDQLFNNINNHFDETLDIKYKNVKEKLRIMRLNAKRGR